MSLRIRALRIVVTTQAKTFEARLSMEDGLVVLGAPNSSGKSTCLQSMIYALGLEGMYGSGGGAHQLPPSLTTAIFDEATQLELPVLESSVLLEVANGADDVITIQRWPRHSQYQDRLIRIHAGPVLTSQEQHAVRDYFVRLPGSAQREGGFHTFLVNFLGWTLPSLLRPDGTEVTLYLEAIFPTMTVEQKRGWAGILNQMPYYLRIPDVQKQAVEFLLDLDSAELARRRRELDLEAAATRDAWIASVNEFHGLAREVGAALEAMPTSPIAEWPPTVAPRLIVADSSGVRSLADELTGIRLELKELESAEIPRIEQVATELGQRLTQTEQALQALGPLGTRWAEEAATVRDQVAAVEARRSALRQDLQRYQDLKRIRDLGSDLGAVGTREECPTCHQELPETLLGREVLPAVMSLEDNERFVQAEVQALDLMGAEMARELSAREQRLAGVRTEASSLRNEIRSLRRTLVTDSRQPASAIIERRVRLRDRSERLARVAESFDVLGQRLADLSGHWRQVEGERASLRSGTLSDLDNKKLDALEQSFRTQLADYRFSSVPVPSVEISRLKYLPVHDGADLGPLISASDFIRAVWAYLQGLLEMARIFPTNHAQLLILDEPRQQDTDPQSFATFLRRASQAHDAGQQVICATSEVAANIDDWLGDLPFQHIRFDGRILQPRG